MTMAQWADRLDAFLEFNERELMCPGFVRGQLIN